MPPKHPSFAMAMADTADVQTLANVVDYVYAFLVDNYPDFAKEMAAKVKRKLTVDDYVYATSPR